MVCLRIGLDCFLITYSIDINVAVITGRSCDHEVVNKGAFGNNLKEFCCVQAEGYHTASHGRNHSVAGCAAFNHRTRAFFLRLGRRDGQGPEACPGQVAPRPVLHRSPPSGGADLHVAVAGRVGRGRKGAPRPLVWWHWHGIHNGRGTLRWLVAQTKPNLVANLGARDDTATNPKHTALASLSCSCELTQSHTLYWSHHLLQFRVFIHLGCCKQCYS